LDLGEEKAKQKKKETEKKIQNNHLPKLSLTVIPCEQAHAPEAEFLGFDA
jgi:hypothetical protein